MATPATPAKPVKSESNATGPGPQSLTAPTVAPVEIVKPARKTRKTVDPNETKSDKFKRLAVHRVSRAVKYTRAIASLANKSQYESTDEQVVKILSAIRDAIESVRLAFAGKREADNGFKL